MTERLSEGTPAFPAASGTPFVTDLLRQGTDIQLIQRLLAHADSRTTMLYTRVSDVQAGNAILRLPTWKDDG